MADRKKAADGKLAGLPNLGPKSQQWLNEVGIYTLDDLQAVGAVEAYRHASLAGFNTSLNLLYALYGALHGLRWNEVPGEIKERLRAEVHAPYVHSNE